MTSTQPGVIRWAIAGPGTIADAVAADFVHVQHAQLLAVGSRSAERAAAFASKHGAERAYGSYRELIADPDVDVVYIATPHPQHLQLALACLQSGKAVLVEKAFTATAAGARELIAAAHAHQVFAMEAMWTRFQPAVLTMRELIADGAIGEVRCVQADLGVHRPFDPAHRLYDPAQGGGALLDLGVYPVSFAHLVLGNPTSVFARGSLAPNGVDAESSVLLGFEGGRTATVSQSLNLALPGSARVYGTQGWIELPPRFHHPTKAVLHRRDADAETFSRPPLGAGYSHELIEVTECLRSGRTESTVMPLADTLSVQLVLDAASAQLGVRHAEDLTVLAG